MSVFFRRKPFSRLVEFVFGDESPPVDGELVVAQALVESRVFGHRRVNLQLTLHPIVAESPLVDLES